MAGGGGSRFLEALDRAQSKKNAGFNINNFNNSEDSEDDTEKDEANLLSVDESDDADLQITEQRPKHNRTGTIRANGDSIKTYERNVRSLHFRPLRGNAIGLNMLGTCKKLGENAQNIAVPSGTLVQGRIFHHTNIPRSAVKTAAQSQERRERKEYPPHVQKVENDPKRISPSKSENTQEIKEDSDLESEPGIKRKVVQQKRSNSMHESDLSLLHTPQISLSHREGTKQSEDMQYCSSCIKENKKTKCQSCGDAQRLCKQSTAVAEPFTLSRPSIHPSEKSSNIALNVKSFYSLTPNKPTMDILLEQDSQRFLCYSANGKIGLSAEENVTKNLKNSRLKLTEPNDPIVLSSDDEENASTGSTSRLENISPRPADSACSSPAPSSGKVEAALKENSFILEHKLCNNSSDAESSIAIPRKAKMKDQFGNSVTNTPSKRRRVLHSDNSCELVPRTYSNNSESVIMSCRSVRIGTFCRAVAEPVVFCLDYIKIEFEVLPEDEGGYVKEIKLKTSELTKSEWCSVRKLPVVFFQTIPATCLSLQSHLKLSRENNMGWYDCKATNSDEQFIVLIFENAPDHQASLAFEKILHEIGLKNKIENFATKIDFNEANNRLVAFTKNNEDIPTPGSVQKDNVKKNAAMEMRTKLRKSSPQSFFEDDDEDTHSVFVGPVEKLIVYPPPPAKGGISVTNEDLHCLNEGEFLNDVIIDFYLKYLILEKLRKDADRIHIFSSFFYKRLNQRERRCIQDTANLTLQQRRHGRVKTWTRHVDIFQKDFIFVPLNEAAHWFLAVICFPGLEKTEYHPNPYYQGGLPSPASKLEGENSSDSRTVSETSLQGVFSKTPLKKTPSKKISQDFSGESPRMGDNDSSCPKRGLARHQLRKIDQDFQESEASVKPIFSDSVSSANDINGTLIKPSDGLHRIHISYREVPEETKKSGDELVDFPDDQDNMDESSDDGGIANENYSSEAGKWHLKQLFCKQPCILLMDSLRGPSRSTVVKTLREYLEVEWEVKKGSKRSFSKDFMKGSNPRVPQQNNFSDCGVYILQYVESFFENPIQSFDLPMNLTDWFPQQRMKTKREEIRKLILTLQGLQSKDKKGHNELSTTQPMLHEKTEQIISSVSD
ncbi:hypothetical protein GDO86_009860 [Hymenochirus boettgeri]|uniref:Sentrin-specific protease 6 n=1 Tax=Hymenochirus boettgeri TaxID=247094 RepID=A0A8T2JMX6_9PIPI|nr:hypothetical protein GDO86_009860 [Hymenochirus boettgeri]